jgi:Tfp pilus assembly protein PilN
MKPLINLSSAPFRNRRLFWLGIAALFVIASFFGLKAIATKSWMEQEIALRQSRVNELRTRFAKVEKPAPTGTTAISQEQNLQLVAANELITRRAFSWTQLLNDLERGLPPTVRVLRVGVATAGEEDRTGAIGAGKNAAVLSMTVIGKSEGDVTTMITRLLDSGRFKVFPISKKPVEGMEDVEFTLQVEYYPPERAATPNQVAVVEKPQP